MDNNEQQQPESGVQEEVKSPVADKLGQLDEAGLSDLLKSRFFDEEEAAPAKEEHKEEALAEDSSSEEVPHAEDDSDQPEAEDSSLTKGVQKRINKLVAAKKAAQAELEAHRQKIDQLSKELEDTKNSVPSKTQEVSDYVGSIDSIEKLSKEYENTIDYLLWCEENPNGGVIKLPDGTEQELTDQQVRYAKSVLIKRKELELPARLNYLKAEEVHNQMAHNDFPWWNKPESDEYRTAQLILKDFPEIKKRRSDWKTLIGATVLGLKTYMDNKSNSAKKSVPIKRAPSQPSVSKAPPSTASSASDVVKAKEKFVKNSSQQGMNDLIKAMGFV